MEVERKVERKVERIVERMEAEALIAGTRGMTLSAAGSGPACALYLSFAIRRRFFARSRATSARAASMFA